MNSSTQHIDPEFRKNQLNLLQSEDLKPMEIMQLSEWQYNHMGKHDPMTCYMVVCRDGRVRSYYGDTPSPMIIQKSTYVMNYHPENQHYGICAVTANGLVEIIQYENVDAAVNALTIYSVIHNHSRLEVSIYGSIISYLNGYINTSDLVISILSAAGLNKRSDFQILMDVLHKISRTKLGNDTLPSEMMDYMELLVKNGVHICDAYLHIYHYLLSTQFLKEQKKLIKTVEFPDCGEEIEQLVAICMNYSIY